MLRKIPPGVRRLTDERVRDGEDASPRNCTRKTLGEAGSALIGLRPPSKARTISPPGIYASQNSTRSLRVDLVGGGAEAGRPSASVCLASRFGGVLLGSVGLRPPKSCLLVSTLAARRFSCLNVAIRAERRPDDPLGRGSYHGEFPRRLVAQIRVLARLFLSCSTRSIVPSRRPLQRQVARLR